MKILLTRIICILVQLDRSSKVLMIWIISSPGLTNVGSSDKLTAAESHWLALTSGHRSLVLERSEQAAANFNVEARFPLLDRRLIEFCTFPSGTALL